VHATDQVVKHIVILSGHGSPSLDAIRFLADQGITWAIIDAGGKSPRILGTSGQTIDAKLMRLQAMAAPGFPLEWAGVQIIRELTTLKLEGQAFNAEYVLSNPQLAKAIRSQIDGALTVTRDTAKDTLASIMGYEGTGADAYWTAWKGIAPLWHRITTVLKPNWLSYPGRKSLRRSETNRKATDPINAALNFGYHAAESWCIIALLAAGLDPRMGIQHVDTDGRASFALDLIETVRPIVDEIVLDIFMTGRLNGPGSERLDPRMLWSDREGIVHVSQPLTGVIAQRVGLRCQTHLSPVVRRIADLLTSTTMSGS